MDRDSRYAQLLAAIFVGAVLTDLVLDAVGLPRLVSQLLLWVLFSTALYFLLLARTQYLGLNRRWAFTAVLPGLGLLVGLVLYFQSPTGAAALPDRQN